MPKFDYSNPYYSDPKNKLVAAASNGDTQTVEKILKTGLHPDAAFKRNMPAALFYACSAGHLEAARALRRAGADVNRYDAKNYPMTYLAVAAQRGHSKIVEWLLEEGADPTIVFPNGTTAADSAANLGHGEIALRLYSAMDIRVSPEQELVFAAQRGDLHAAERLLDRGIAGTTNVGGFNAFMWACMCGHEPVVRLMLNRGASPYTTGSIDGIPAMAWASVKGHTAVMDTLHEFDQRLDKIFPATSELPNVDAMLRDHLKKNSRKAKSSRGKSKRHA